ncbi:MAG: hypothetical protein P1U63_07755 [Coxiellaceae bacterium]|nr:hypothetical protein [Coxiellaceae bacterium]
MPKDKTMYALKWLASLTPETVFDETDLEPLRPFMMRAAPCVMIDEISEPGVTRLQMLSDHEWSDVKATDMVYALKASSIISEHTEQNKITIGVMVASKRLLESADVDIDFYVFSKPEVREQCLLVMNFQLNFLTGGIKALHIKDRAVAPSLRGHKLSTKASTEVLRQCYLVCGDMMVSNNAIHIVTARYFALDADQRMFLVGMVADESGKLDRVVKGNQPLSALLRYHCAASRLPLALGSEAKEATASAIVDGGIFYDTSTDAVAAPGGYGEGAADSDCCDLFDESDVPALG